jgi:hypothetical protein
MIQSELIYLIGVKPAGTIKSNCGPDYNPTKTQCVRFLDASGIKLNHFAVQTWTAGGLPRPVANTRHLCMYRQIIISHNVFCEIKHKLAISTIGTRIAYPRDT